ncbi:MAG: DUF4410 domain-containing protein [Chthoniobacterales bacterium]|nr:DUF4410 domain-containing protein [Chthoniobacterales bacterium]
MKSFTVIASSLLLCSCADMVVTKTYVSNSATRTTAQVDSKDFGSVETVRYETNCGVGATNPSAIYIRPFCIDRAIFTGDEAASAGEMPIRKALTPIQFAGDLKEELSKLAPARIISDDEVPEVGWLVEGQFDLVDGGSPVGRFFLGQFGVGRSFLALHVKVTDVEKHRVIYEFDMAGGSRLQGKLGTVRASGLGKATPFDLRNAAERVLLVLSPDPFRYGARSSVSLR